MITRPTYIACLDSFGFDTLTPLDKNDRETVLSDFVRLIQNGQVENTNTSVLQPTVKLQDLIGQSYKFEDFLTH